MKICILNGSSGKMVHASPSNVSQLVVSRSDFASSNKELTLLTMVNSATNNRTRGHRPTRATMIAVASFLCAIVF